MSTPQESLQRAGRCRRPQISGLPRGHPGATTLRYRKELLSLRDELHARAAVAQTGARVVIFEVFNELPH
jgi:hypothetical protein